MTQITYGMKTRTSMDIHGTETRLREALTAEGSGS